MLRRYLPLLGGLPLALLACTLLTPPQPTIPPPSASPTQIMPSPQPSETAMPSATPTPQLTRPFTATPTALPTPTEPLPTSNGLPTLPAPYAICAGAPLARLGVGYSAYVSTHPPVANRVRADPGTTSAVIGQVEPGEGLVIIGGPQCANNMVWWNIQTLNTTTKVEGWTAEGNAEGYWLIPCLPGTRCGK